MRLPRLFAKKRGHRRTGAEVWGSIGEALFHAVLVVAGLAFGGLLVTGVAVPEWRINHDFVAAEGLIVGKGLARRHDDGDHLAAEPPAAVRDRGGRGRGLGNSERPRGRS